jgi:microcystin-dependent protein
MFAGNFAPAGWALCQGQLMPISENDTLFQLIGTTYGGDGQSTFGLPDLQGRVPIHQGTFQSLTSVIGQKSGTETVSVTIQTMPLHTHPFLASTNPGKALTPIGNVLAAPPTIDIYKLANPGTAMNAQAVTTDMGGNQPHDNMQPYLCINFIISLFGIFPSQT